MPVLADSNPKHCLRWPDGHLCWPAVNDTAAASVIATSMVKHNICSEIVKPNQIAITFAI